MEVPGIMLKAFGALSKLATSQFQRVKKNRDVDAVIAEYKDRAAFFSNGSFDLVKLFQCSEKLDEFIENCRTGEVSKARAVSLFLYDAPNLLGKNPTIEEFISRLYDEIAGISDETHSNDAKALEAMVRRSDRDSVERDERILEEITRLPKKREKEGLEIVQKLVRSVERGDFDICDLTFDADRCHESKAMNYLATYLDLCKGRSPRCGIAGFIDLPEELLLSLASLAFSAGEVKYCVGLIDGLSDSEDCVDAINALASKSEHTDPLLEHPITPDSKYYSLIASVTADYLFEAKAFCNALEMYQIVSERLNPIARARLSICGFYDEWVLSDAPASVDLLAGFCGSVPRWASNDLLESFQQISSSAIETLNDETASRVLELLPEDCMVSFSAVKDRIRLHRTEDPSTIAQVMEFAYKAGNGLLYFESIEKLRSYDEASVNAELSVGGPAERLAQQDFVSFLCFARKVVPNISREDYFRLGMAHSDRAAFFLLAHCKFEEDIPICESEYLENAIVLMKAGFEFPTIEFAPSWIAYLHESGRDNEILEMLNGAYRWLPFGQIKDLVFSIGFESDRDDLLVEVLNGFEEHSEGRADLLAFLASCEYRREGADWPKIRSLAMKSFELRKSDAAAYFAIEAMIRLHEVPPRELSDFASSSKHQGLLFALATTEDLSGDDVNRDIHVIRGILAGGEDSDRGIAWYTIRHMPDDISAPNMVAPDTVAGLELDDGETIQLAFHSISGRVCGEGVFAAGAFHYTAKSREFMNMRGACVGDSRTMNGRSCKVISLASLNDHLCSEGLRVIVASPSTQVISAPEGEFNLAFEQIKKAVEKNAEEGKKRFSLFKEGIEVGNGLRFHLGVESGKMLFNGSQLGFTIECFLDPDMPFKRPEPGATYSVELNSRFLVSYNAVIAIALLLRKGFSIDALSEHFVVTSAAARRLREDINILVRESETSAGKLVSDDGHLRMVVNGDEFKGEVRAIADNILTVLDALDMVDLDGAPRIPKSSRILSFNHESVLDMATAAEHGLVYITEDPMHFVLNVLIEGGKACTLPRALISIGRMHDALEVVIPAYRDWGADPFIDVEISSALNRVIEELLQGAGGQRYFEDNQSNEKEIKPNNPMEYVVDQELPFQ